MSEELVIQQRVKVVNDNKENLRLRLENLKRKNAILVKQFKQYGHKFPAYDPTIIKKLQSLTAEVIVLSVH